MFTVETGKSLSITAEFEQTTRYTVTFHDWDDEVLKTEKVYEGEDATAPKDPYREGYTFIGWDKALENITSDLLVIAQYEQNPETGIEEVESSLLLSPFSARKVLRDGILYIERNGVLYDAQGLMVK